MGEWELPAILQSRWAESVFWDSHSQASTELLTVPEHAEAISGFGSIDPNWLLSQYQVKWGYKLAGLVHLWFSCTVATIPQWTVDTELSVQGMLAAAFHIPIKHPFTSYQARSGINRLHLHVKCLDWCVCTMSMNSKSKKTWWEWPKLKVHYLLQVHALQWLICRSWGMHEIETYIHNDLQLVLVGFIHIQEAHSEQDWRSQLCMIFNHRPEKPWQQKLHLSLEYPNRVSASDSLGCGSEVCQNLNNIPAQAATLPQISEPMSHILTQVLNIT